MAGNVMEVGDANFQKEVLDASLPVLVDFWAPWCGPCRMVAPVVEELSREMGDKVKFTKLNVDDNQMTAARYGIMAIPSLLVFKGGQVAQQHVGALSKAALKSLLEKVL
ncbi:MAG: thioredoxin [Acidobacteriota bacterium]